VTQQSNSQGVQGVIPTDAPKQGATIVVPSNGQVFHALPITVSGLCPSNLLVEIFKNNVFAGSTTCANGSYSLQIDLFDGQNDLVARVYDSLNQAGPDSNTVSVTFSQSLPGNGPRMFLTSAYAERGAQPGTSLTWPLTLSGGTGPYAISVDWGDQSQPELLSRKSAGDFNIDHVYAKAGTYKITVKATDANGQAAFLQLVGVGNGPIKQTAGSSNGNSIIVINNNRLLIPLIAALVVALLSFWLGKKHGLQTIKNNLAHGKKPFK
jgi:hypothetical protein